MRVDLSMSIDNRTQLKGNDFDSYIARYTMSLEKKHIVLELQDEKNKYYKTAFVNDHIIIIDIEDNVIVITTVNQVRIYFPLKSVKEALKCQEYLIDKIYEINEIDKNIRYISEEPL